MGKGGVFSKVKQSMRFEEKYNLSVTEAYKHYIGDRFWQHSNPYRMRTMMNDLFVDINKYGSNHRFARMKMLGRIVRSINEQIEANRETSKYYGFKTLCK